MSGHTLSDEEAACLRKLAERFEKGQTSWTHKEGWESIGLTNNNYKPVLQFLERCGYINHVTHTHKAWYFMFTIDPSSVQGVRLLTKEEKDKQEPKDKIDLAKSWIRKHPVIGWFALVAITFGFLITVANQVVSLLKNLGVI